MRYIPSPIPEIVQIETRAFSDTRGSLTVTFNRDQFAEAGLPTDFVQHNLSRSRRGVLRGLHYQIEHPQGKLILVPCGRIFDVAVDIRRSSPTFGQWMSQELSGDDNRLLWVPPGFAHGFYVLSERADVMYYVTDRYSPGHERTLLWNDEELAIEWPIPEGETPIMSEKDHAGTRLSDADVFE